jgi:hypothetical protein
MAPKHDVGSSGPSPRARGTRDSISTLVGWAVKMSRRLKTLLCLVAGLAGPLTGAAQAIDFQSLSPNPAFQNKAASTPASVTFVYTASNANTVGLGIRIHFNSNRLVYSGVTNIFGAPSGGGPLFVMGPSTVSNDTGNEDADAATDKIVLLAWAHTMANPGQGFPGTLPQNLFTINFTTAASFPSATNVRVTAVGSPTGFSFSSSAATIAPPGVATPTPTTTPVVTPTPTPTATPGGIKELDIDHNGAVGTFSDGLLVLRYLSGLRGTNLVTGVVAGNCTPPYCTAPGIETYIASMLVTFDIDHNGTTGTFSDGLLILRYLSGFRGANLVTGVVAPNCTVPYCTAPAIETYIEGLVN